MKSRLWMVVLVVAGIGALWGCAVEYRSAPAGDPQSHDRIHGTPVPRSPGDLALRSVLEESQRVKGLRSDDLWVVSRPTNQGGLGLGYAATPGIPRGGELRTKLAEREVPLPLKHTDVKAQVALSLASVTLVQQYHNPYSEKIEAVYVFPLPEDAAVREFVMTIGDRQIRGIIREREEAKRIYEAAKRQGFRAALMEQDRPNIFAQSVANIEPGKSIDISITYFHSVRYEDDAFEFVIPTVVGPRFNPPGTTGGVGAIPHGGAPSGQKRDVEYLSPEQVSSADIAIEVDIEAGAAIEKIESPSHAVDISRRHDGHATVKLAANDRIPNRDFVLRWSLKGKRVQGAVAAHRDGEDSYFLLMLHPPALIDDIPAPPREVVIVVDVSGSMQGEPLAIAKRAAVRALQRLRPADTFRILWFSNDVFEMNREPLGASAANVKEGIRCIEGLKTAGGTYMIKPIVAALQEPKEGKRHRVVAFLTDGYIGNEAEILEAASKHVGDARIFTMGIGSSVNRYIITALAQIGRGASCVVGLDESAAAAMDKLFVRLERPAMTNLRIQWNGLEVVGAYPQTVPDLMPGRPAVVAVKCRGSARGFVRVTGRVADAEASINVPVDFEAAGARHRAIPAVWARHRLAELHLKLATGGGAEVAEELKSVAIRHGLMSEFTSFVAVDTLERTKGDHGVTVTQPVPVPKGVKYETTVPGEKK